MVRVKRVVWANSDVWVVRVVRVVLVGVFLGGQVVVMVEVVGVVVLVVWGVGVELMDFTELRI